MRSGARGRAFPAALRAGGPPTAEAEAAVGLPPGAVEAAVCRQHLPTGHLSRAPPRLYEKAEPGVWRGTARPAAGREGADAPRGGLAAAPGPLSVLIRAPAAGRESRVPARRRSPGRRTAAQRVALPDPPARRAPGVLPRLRSGPRGA